MKKAVGADGEMWLPWEIGAFFEPKTKKNAEKSKKSRRRLENLTRWVIVMALTGRKEGKAKGKQKGKNMIIPSKYMTSKAATTPAAPAATAVEEESESLAEGKDYSSLGRVWEKGSFHRLYLEPKKVAKAIGMSVEFYGSGNVFAASMNGEKISNTRAHEALTSWDGAFIDLVTGEVCENRSGRAVRYADEIAEAYRAIAD